MRPPKGHNHHCWASGCSNRVLYRGGVWYSFCERHLEINGWGPFWKPKRDHKLPEARDIKEPKFPNGYDPDSFMMDLRGGRIFHNPRMKIHKAISIMLKRRGMIK